MTMSTPTIARSPARLLGLALIAAGAACNRYSLAYLFAKDRLIEDGATLNKILALQAILILLGLVTLVGWKPTRLPSPLRGVLAVVLLGVAGFGTFASLRGSGRLEMGDEARQTAMIKRMVASEVVHLNVTPRLKKLSKSLANLRVPSGEGEAVVADEVTVRDIESFDHAQPYGELETVATKIYKWHVAEEEHTFKKPELSILRAFLDRVELIDPGKFYLVGGDFLGDEANPDFTQWEVAAGFTGLGKLKQGGYAKFKGDLKIRWHLKGKDGQWLPASGDPTVVEGENNPFENWMIDRIAFESFKTFEAPGIFFSEELDKAIPDPAALAQARRNIAQEHIVEMFLAQKEGKEWTPPHEFWGHQASWRHDTVSVVDLDRDGFDDFYTMPRYGTNQLFHNNGDGTFTDVAKDVGLDVTDHTGASIFADFDNDGDSDVFLGRTIARSLYKVNEGGKFVDAAARVDQPLPYFVVSASAADYDQDGLLDLYASTYAAQLMDKDLRKKRAEGTANGMTLENYLPEKHARKLFELYRAMLKDPLNKVRDRVGPPNVLLHNEGGGTFKVVEDHPLQVYRNTFQSTWADHDNDGDVDVYVSSDFAPNNLFQNDGGGKFTDVTAATNAADVGFGMGDSWGDYDKDGDQDLYVSNMYSKAGNRILKQVSDADRQLLKMAGGNSLMQLDKDHFNNVATLDGANGTKAVEMGGWSWGSQWVDFDNDSWLDIYSLSGHYSAPKEIEAGHDL
jgi:hypothetical protein